MTEPIALPDVHKPLANPLKRSKYVATINTPGGKASPAPIPTSTP